MSGPVTGLRHLQVDPNKEDIQKIGTQLAHGLVDRYGEADSLAMLMVAAETMFLAILHAQSPMPEQNIASVKRMLEALSENVLAHEACALYVNGRNPRTKSVVH